MRRQSVGHVCPRSLKHSSPLDELDLGESNSESQGGWPRLDPTTEDGYTRLE